MAGVVGGKVVTGDGLEMAWNAFMEAAGVTGDVAIPGTGAAVDEFDAAMLDNGSKELPEANCCGRSDKDTPVELRSRCVDEAAPSAVVLEGTDAAGVD